MGLKGSVGPEKVHPLKDSYKSWANLEIHPIDPGNYNASKAANVCFLNSQYCLQGFPENHKHILMVFFGIHFFHNML